MPPWRFGALLQLDWRHLNASVHACIGLSFNAEAVEPSIELLELANRGALAVLGGGDALAQLQQISAAFCSAEFAESFLQGVFADGIDAGSDAGLQWLIQRAGLDPSVLAAALTDQSWRAVAEANRAEMFSLGLWGVPSFRVDHGPAYWGAGSIVVGRARADCRDGGALISMALRLVLLLLWFQRGF